MTRFNMLNMRFKNTITQEKELFVPFLNNHVGMYVCGITPYDFAHVGHGRCYVTFDVVYRLLTTLGYEVTYCRNFTDIDDKLLLRAEQEYGDSSQYLAVAHRFIQAYHQDMQSMNCLNPDHEPRVTETIPEIIEFIAALIKKGHAYESHGSVYFAIDSCKDYCKLSKRNSDELKIGARVNINDDKKNPLDFVLWKSDDRPAFWMSPWGRGRPGWHIECSVMAKKFLGEVIDIHGGGMDLIFPHHENEIAQSESLHDNEFVRFWLHNAFVQIEKEKMSKSLGNFFTLRHLFETFDPMVVRFMFLNHHYRSPLDFSIQDLHVAEKTYRRLIDMFDQVTVQPLDLNNMLVKRMMDFLCDDLNSTGMFGVLFENSKEIQNNAMLAGSVKRLLVTILGLTCLPLPKKNVELTSEINQLIEERARARAEKNWEKADFLRIKLEELGYEIQDKKI